MKPSTTFHDNIVSNMNTPTCGSPSSCEFEGGSIVKDNESDIDNFDFENFKGIYIDEDPNRKYQDPETGCHFEYYDLCKRMAKLKILRKKLDEQLGLPPAPDSPDERATTINNARKKSHDMQVRKQQSHMKV